MRVAVLRYALCTPRVVVTILFAATLVSIVLTGTLLSLVVPCVLVSVSRTHPPLLTRYFLLSLLVVFTPLLVW